MFSKYTPEVVTSDSNVPPILRATIGDDSNLAKYGTRPLVITSTPSPVASDSVALLA